MIGFDGCNGVQLKQQVKCVASLWFTCNLCVYGCVSLILSSGDTSIWDLKCPYLLITTLKGGGTYNNNNHLTVGWLHPHYIYIDFINIYHSKTQPFNNVETPWSWFTNKLQDSQTSLSSILSPLAHKYRDMTLN